MRQRLNGVSLCSVRVSLTACEEQRIVGEPQASQQSLEYAHVHARHGTQHLKQQ